MTTETTAPATETKAETKVQPGIQLSITPDLTTATLGGTTVQITPAGDVTVYTDVGIETQPVAAAAEAAATTQTAAAAAPAETDIKIGLSKTFNEFTMYGAKVGLAADGSFTVSTAGKTKIKPVSALSL